MSITNIIAFEPIECDDSWVVTNSNPRFWEQDGVRNIFKAVYAPSFPKIEEAYAAAGKGVYRDGELIFTEADNSEQEYDGDTSDADLDSPLSADDFMTSDVTDINDTSPVNTDVEEEATEGDAEAVSWRELSWPKMRSLATQFTDEPIKSKEQAQEVLEQAEVDGKL